MDERIMQVAERIRGLRQMLDISPEEMAKVCGVSLSEYLECEEGRNDFSFTFIFKCAERFGVDMAELVTGDAPKLSQYSLVRYGHGMPIQRRKGFSYQHMGYLFRNRLAEPFIVKAGYSQEEQVQPIPLSTHEGQEFDMVLKGRMRFQLGTHLEELGEGDCVYYDSTCPHGMMAVGGSDCEFLAVVIKREDGNE